MKHLSFEKKIVIILMAALLMTLGSSAYLVWGLLDESLSIGLNPRLRSQMLSSLDVYKELFRTQKQLFTTIGSQIAEDAVLGRAIKNGDLPLMTDFIEEASRSHPELISVELISEGTHRLLWHRPGVNHEARSFTGEYEIPQSEGKKIVIKFEPPERQFTQMKDSQSTVELYGHVSELKAKIGGSLALAYFAVFSAVIIIVIFFAIYNTRKFIRPLRELAAATEKVGKGDLDVKITPTSGDEIGDLTVSFNKMVKELGENRGRIIYLEKISSWQDIARRLAHEIKNPLTPINLAMQELHVQYKGDDESYRRLLDQTREIVQEEISSLKRMVDAFSSFAKLPAVQLEPLEADLVIREFLEAHNNFVEFAAVTFTPGSNGKWCRMDRLIFRRVLDNLVKNAIEASEKGRLNISISTTFREGLLEISVSDDGPGIPPELQEKIFNPYFTTKAEGTGLGLPIARKIVLDHGGDLSVQSKKGEGTTFTITLPALANP